MGLMQRRKGASGEREIVNLLKAAGIPAKRISMMETGGIDKGDIEVAGKKAQVKRGNFVPKFFYTARCEGETYLFVRRDKEKWLVTMDFEEFIRLL